MPASSNELTPEELNDLLGSYMPDIPGYRVLRRIGRGGMSHVYLGVQESLDRQVAIKVMSPEALTDEISKQRFEQEARTIAKLEHPCIVGIHEVGRTEHGLLFYVLPYLAKGHLGQRDFSQDESRIVEVLRSLLSALEYAHARGIVHRDVKAENVLFDNADRPLLTDFGIALSKRDSTRITTTGLAVGSGGYMAPEQARGEVVDGRADLYSVGVLAYELLMGRLPFQHPDALALALMHAQDPVPRLPLEKKHWQPFIDRAMAKSADHRFRNAQQMFAALNQIEADRQSSGRSWLPRAIPAPPPTWRKPLLAGTAAALVVASAIAFWPRAQPDASTPDFFTLDDARPQPQATAKVSAPPAAAPAPAAPPTSDQAPAPEPEATPAAPPVETATPAATDDPAAGSDAIAEVRLTRLEYDPTQPAARELMRARQQIAQGQLSLPPGDNALESLRAAHALAPDSPELAALAQDWLARVATHVQSAVSARRDDQASGLQQRATALVEQFGLTRDRRWQQTQVALAATVKTRLKADIDAGNVAALTASKALAGQLGIASAALEPEWSQAIARAQPKPGDRIASGRSELRLVRLPQGSRPGLAAMPVEVTREQYAAFAAGRSEARCRNRTAPIALKRRSWTDPGFAQSGNHPVVCISANDAIDFADWLGRRDGQRYRLPTATEWRLMANYRSGGDACAAGRVACGSEGTAAASSGPTSPLGLRGLQGNVREWLSDCIDGCRKRLVAGPGWRDSPSRAEPLGTQDLDVAIGFDDVGFRLVREVTAAELGLR
ncbi:MAG TPA: protein kinase [Arenimonas sp.]|nr:protein kinase [Arenimonas sp.]